MIESLLVSALIIIFVLVIFMYLILPIIPDGNLRKAAMAIVGLLLLLYVLRVAGVY